MTIADLEKQLKKLGEQRLDLNFLLSEANRLKVAAVLNNNEAQAKQLWIYETILAIHRDFNGVFNLLRAKKYQDSWSLLEQIDISISFLKRHFSLEKNHYKVHSISNAVKRIQALYPYRLFGSSEILSLEERCGICKAIVSIRRPCGHIIGEIYQGEMCTREISKSEFLGIAIVENPGNKYSVLFKEIDDPKVRDEQYGNLVLLLACLKSPYEHWGLKIEQRLLPHSQFPNLKANDACPCGDGKDYKDCCLLEPGISYFHYEILLTPAALNRVKKKSKKRR